MNNINIRYKNDATGAFSFAAFKDSRATFRFRLVLKAALSNFAEKGTDRLSIRRKVVAPIA